MNQLSVKSFRILILFLSLMILNVFSCKKDDNPIKFPRGTFPDSTIILTGINSQYDDYNMDLHQLLDYALIIFSSNRISTGEHFDLVQGVISYFFNQTTGDFGVESEMTQNAFITKLISAANTDGDDLGPYTLFSPADGYEYLLYSSQSAEGDLDFNYLRNQPVTGASQPAILGPYPVKLLNTGSDDAYISFDTNQDSVYFSSDTEGNFDIYIKTRPAETTISEWFDGDYSASQKADSINSSGNDKCPFVFRKYLVFASDRPGGFGGFDLYYSVFRKGKWSSPVNFGPDINTTDNEYRPVLGSQEDFTNNFMIFSSDRPGGKGRFDLYMRGITFPER
ncbi:MAG TPA: hypothetical protein PKX27_08070 [Bacteroidales bacterium]|nr:hypothetical protein [Bacteroidales bacterium]HQM68908.1 hypothetical protein [Bacteroidales bacterium]